MRNIVLIFCFCHLKKLQTPNQHHINPILTPIGELTYRGSCSLLTSKVGQFLFPKLVASLIYSIVALPLKKLNQLFK